MGEGSEEGFPDPPPDPPLDPRMVCMYSKLMRSYDRSY